MAQVYTTLSGHWIGRYDYNGRGAPVAFEARIDEGPQGVLGDITEPNSFKNGMGPSLSAHMSGARAGDSVSFIKTYHGLSTLNRPMYDGTVNAALTRIEGGWRFDDPQLGTGAFSMVRVEPKALEKSLGVLEELGLRGV